MDVNRRRFLSLVSAGLAAAALDPERLLWTPGEKRIFVMPPAADAWGASSLLRPGDIITIEGIWVPNQKRLPQQFVVLDVVKDDGVVDVSWNIEIAREYL